MNQNSKIQKPSYKIHPSNLTLHTPIPVILSFSIFIHKHIIKSNASIKLEATNNQGTCIASLSLHSKQIMDKKYNAVKNCLSLTTCKQYIYTLGKTINKNAATITALSEEIAHLKRCTSIKVRLF